MGDRKDYEVGFGRPPKEHCFKKGQSGNPKGRPRRPKTQAEILAQVRDEPIAILVEGKRKWVSPLHAVALRALQVALAKGSVVDLMRLYSFLKEEGFDWRREMMEDSKAQANAVIEKIFLTYDREHGLEPQGVPPALKFR